MTTPQTDVNLSTVGSRLRLMAILLIVLGILALLCPLTTGVAIAYLVGGLIVVAGIVRLLHAFQSGSVGEGVFAFIIGLVMVIGGVLMLLHPVMNLMALTLLMAIYFFVEGFFTLVGGVRMAGKPGWGFVIFNGVVTLLLGLLIWWEWPLSGAWALGVLVGIHLLLTGVQLLAVGTVTKRFGAATA
jgi:uncharacterized membrane protein HdeD (DUF308 family)